MTQHDLERVAVDDTTLSEIEDRVLWLATAMIHHANRVRPNPSGVKVGGHQASSASMVTIMTDLWFRHLTAADRVSVKPHASPVLHAINYLTGRLDASYLPRLRELGGLQPYPSRTKDPDPVDYSTGSVGIGATAPIWGALARRFLDGRTPSPTRGREYSLLGDAELDEGAVWEAILDPQVQSLGEVVWIVDLNRQSLDRVAPRIMTSRFDGLFRAAGWQVITVKWGERIRGLFEQPGGDALRDRMEGMTNPEYQRMLRRDAAELRSMLPGEGPGAAQIAAVIGKLSDEDLLAAFRDLGGHSFAALDEAFEEIDDTRPTVILAYTLKGYRLASEGHPQNHSALLNDDQLGELADRLGTSVIDPWAELDEHALAAVVCAQTGRRLTRPPVPAAVIGDVPRDFGRTPGGVATTQAALGRALLDLSRASEEVARRVVTVSPDVSSSTNLGGWVNKVGVWSYDPLPSTNWFADDPETILQWAESPSGQHIELGIAEVNLVGLLGELGATWRTCGQPLLPIGVMYDPFVNRALEPWTYGIYAGGQSILVGTPSGVTLSAEGGAHQSITTPSIGLEQPGVIAYEPAFAIDLEWTLLAALSRLGRPDGTSSYLRLSTLPVDQRLAQIPADPAARDRRRRQAVAGAYRLLQSDSPDVIIAAMGSTVPNAHAAVERLQSLGVPADLVVVTSPGLLFDAHRLRHGQPAGQYADPGIIEQIFPASRTCPIVSVLDGHPHTLAFLGTINGTPIRTLGVVEFGQAGSVEDIHRLHAIDTDAIVAAALDSVR